MMLFINVLWLFWIFAIGILVIVFVMTGLMTFFEAIKKETGIRAMKITLLMLVGSYVFSGFWKAHFLEEEDYYTQKMLIPQKWVLNNLDLFELASNELLNNHYQEEGNKNIPQRNPLKNDALRINRKLTTLQENEPALKKVKRLGNVNGINIKRDSSITFYFKRFNSPLNSATSNDIYFTEHYLVHYPKGHGQSGQKTSFTVLVDENWIYRVRKMHRFVW